MSTKLTDANEILFRQVHPSFYQNGQPSSQPFAPTPKDENKLSTDRSSLVTPQESFANFVACGFASAAVYGLTVGEFGVESIGCISDPIVETANSKANPAHAYADYSPHKSSKQKLIAKRLKQAAIQRGCLHGI